MIAAAGLAYFTRPEGLLLPVAVVATLALMPLVRSTRLNWPRWWAAVGLLVIVPALVVGPYMAHKGGLGTKPAIARLLGTAPPSGADAVERSERARARRDRGRRRRLGRQDGLRVDPRRADAAGPAAGADRPLLRPPRGCPRRPALPLPRGPAGRLGVGLVRLHATGGYCTPRHALIPALLLFPFAAMGLDRLLGLVRLPSRSSERAADPIRLGPMFWPIALALVAAPVAAGIAVAAERGPGPPIARRPSG